MNFVQIKDANIRKEFQLSGIEIIEYIEYGTGIRSITLKDNIVGKIFKIEYVEYKSHLTFYKEKPPTIVEKYKVSGTINNVEVKDQIFDTHEQAQKFTDSQIGIIHNLTIDKIEVESNE